MSGSKSLSKEDFSRIIDLLELCEDRAQLLFVLGYTQGRLLLVEKEQGLPLKPMIAPPESFMRALETRTITSISHTNEEARLTAELTKALEDENRANAADRAPQPPLSTAYPGECWCNECERKRLATLYPHQLLRQTVNRRFVVCPDCGNKRCPKAQQHDRACTNSNATGQPGGG